MAGAEQQVVFAWQHFGAAAAQQVGFAWQQVATVFWQHGAGAAATAHGAGAGAAAQHFTLTTLHLTGLQQSLASAAPLNAVTTAKAALNATNFRLRLMLSPFQR